MPERIYAIGDIHGHLEKLVKIHRWIEADRKRTRDSAAPVVHVGDLVDRGPDSAGVIEYLSKGIERGEPWIVLKGNHDRMFETFLEDPDERDPGLRAALAWSHPRLGGNATLASYGVDVGEFDMQALHEAAIAAVPNRHREFLAGLPFYHRALGCFFVHAGIRPGVPIEEQTEEDMIWIRSPFLEDTRDHGALIIHGHTPVGAPTHYGNRVNIDTGAGYGDPLCAIVVEGSEVFCLTEDDRINVIDASGAAR